ncbi:hypothetical protein [uncultured Psychroserpens sp.]|uniref:hypothetical protein n=1 Tax=uncultured Psychroserpens sp. TaxID=255436 RepID=UPI00262CB35E|nr:hypothetical protein [uncultured Psychroserpens sp.]
MKIFTLIVSIIALALMGYNMTKINLDHPFEGESVIALITILASLCAIVLLQVLRLSKRVNQKLKKQ